MILIITVEGAIIMAVEVSKRVVLCAAPTATGKSFMVKALRVMGYSLLSSCTTRNPRPGERSAGEGEQYNFVGVDWFRSEVEAGNFLEWVSIPSGLYGTHKDCFKQGGNLPLFVREVDIDGVLSLQPILHQRGVSTFSVFLQPPSLTHLESRLRGRPTTETEAVLLGRLKKAGDEMAQFAAN